MFVVIDPEGTRWLCAITPELMADLRSMFTWIESHDPAVRRRLEPDTFADPDEEKAWRKLMGGELSHLVASRRQVVEADLDAAVQIGETGWLRIPVPEGHHHAWLSSLNAARLALFALHGLTSADLEKTDDELPEGHGEVLSRIHLFGFLQEMLMAAPNEADEVDDDEPPPAEP